MVCHLFREGVGECADVDGALAEVAARAASGKDTTTPPPSFVRAPADDVTPGYPDAALPTLLVYHDGACVASLKGRADVAAPGGGRPTPASVLAALQRAAPGLLSVGGGGRGGGSDSE